jgi:hypothetical protein
MKKHEMGGACVARAEIRNALSIMITNLGRQRQGARRRHRRKDSISIHLR